MSIRFRPAVLGLWFAVCLPVLAFAYPIRGDDSDGDDKGRPTVVVDPELFYAVARSKEKEVKLGEGRVGFIKEFGGKKVIFVEQKMKVPPGEQQLFVFRGSPTATFWYPPPENLVKDVTDKAILPDWKEKDGDKKKVGGVGVVAVFEFTGKKGRTSLQFEYKRGEKGIPSWVYKVEVEGG